jgi:hypothetical protein
MASRGNKVIAYEDTSTAFRGRALATQTFDLSIRIHLVVLEDGHLGLLALVLDLFGSLWIENREKLSMRNRQGGLRVLTL